MFTTIGIIIDVAIVLLFLILGFIGYRKGFLNSILSLFSWFVCLVVSILVAKYVANWINGIFNISGAIGNSLKSPITNLNELFTKQVNSYYDGDNQLAIDTIVGEVNSLNINGFLKQIIKMVISNCNVNCETCTSTIGELASTCIGKLIVIVGCAIVLFALLELIIFITKKIVNKLSKARVIGKLNKILGLVFGVIKAGFIVVAINLLVIVLTLIPAVNNTMSPIIKENTYVEKVIYQTTDNVVDKYVVKGELLKNWFENLWEAR